MGGFVVQILWTLDENATTYSRSNTMAELGIAASVVQLIQFSGAVLIGCYTYISKAKNVMKEIRQVINDVSGLKRVLKQLHLFVSSGDK